MLKCFSIIMWICSWTTDCNHLFKSSKFLPKKKWHRKVSLTSTNFVQKVWNGMEENMPVKIWFIEMVFSRKISNDLRNSTKFITGHDYEYILSLRTWLIGSWIGRYTCLVGELTGNIYLQEYLFIYFRFNL